MAEILIEKTQNAYGEDELQVYDHPDQFARGIRV